MNTQPSKLDMHNKVNIMGSTIYKTLLHCAVVNMQTHQTAVQMMSYLRSIQISIYKMIYLKSVIIIIKLNSMLIFQLTEIYRLCMQIFGHQKQI